MSERRFWGQRLAQAGAALVLTVTLAACAEVNTLREAQDAYNRAAQAESAARAQPAETMTPDAGIVTLGAGSGGYQQAFTAAGDLLEDSEAVASLRDDRLLGSVYTIRALSAWRLDDMDAALDTARAATALPEDQLTARDRALMLALPGMVQTEQSLDVIQAAGQPERIRRSDCAARPEHPLCRVDVLVGHALDDFQAAAATVPVDHPVQPYVVLSAAGAVANLKAALNRFGTEGTAMLLTEDDICWLRTHGQAVANAQPGQASGALTSRMVSIIEMPLDGRGC